MKKPGIIFCAAAVAFTLIFLCFFNFRRQVNSYIEEDMRSQIEAIQKNCTLLIHNEMDYLKQLTASTALTLSRLDIQTEAEILQILRDYANTANVIRTLFITLDGHAYTSYAGYLGQSDENTSIDGLPLSEITAPIFSQPYYAEELDEIIFGVIAPVTLGSKRGVLISSYNIKEFPKLLESELIGGSSEIGIVNSGGKVVSGKSIEQFNINIFDSLRSVKFENSSVETVQSDFADGKSGFAVYSADGIARYCSYAPVKLNDWYVVVTVKESALRSKLVNLEQYGLQLTVELVIIMLSLLCVIIADQLKEQRKIRIILEQAARLDSLTGIYNRKAIEEAIEQSLQSTGEQLCSALLVIDLDDFKRINDKGGHLFGDRVLKACASQLDNLFVSEGIVGRIGGDEFVVFLQDGRDSEGIEKKMNELLQNFYVPTITGEKQKISISAGIAYTGPQTNSFVALYQLADAALYRAKQTGKAKISN